MLVPIAHGVSMLRDATVRTFMGVSFDLRRTAYDSAFSEQITLMSRAKASTTKTRGMSTFTGSRELCG
jgi:hypothetical protein